MINEVQFAGADQVDALAQLVNDRSIDIHALGLSADFLLNIFPGSARLFAIADWAHELPHGVVPVWSKGPMQCSRGERRSGPRG